MNYTILRYGLLGGAPTTATVYRLRQAIDNKSIVYDGNPESMREYIHVTDAARPSVQILEDAYANRHIILPDTNG